MPTYSVKGPDGKTYSIDGPEGATREQVISAIQERLSLQPTLSRSVVPKKLGGLKDMFFESAKTLGLADEAAAFAANPNEENRKALLAAGNSKFRTVGFGEGENWAAFKQLLGGSLGQMVAPVAAATAGSFATPIAGVAAGFGASAAQYEAQNLLRQAQEQERAIAEGRTPEEVNLGKSLVASAGQAGLDVVQAGVFAKLFRALPFTRNLLLPEKEAAQQAVDKIVRSAEQGTLKYRNGIASGAVKGVAFEIPQEVAQTVLERWQAGLSLTDDEAQGEYTQAAIGAAILGTSLGGAAGAVGTARERGIAEAEQARRDAEAARREAPPETGEDTEGDTTEGALPPEPPAPVAAEPVVEKVGETQREATERRARELRVSTREEADLRTRETGLRAREETDLRAREEARRRPIGDEDQMGLPLEGGFAQPDLFAEPSEPIPGMYRPAEEVLGEQGLKPKSRAFKAEARDLGLRLDRKGNLKPNQFVPEVTAKPSPDQESFEFEYQQQLPLTLPSELEGQGDLFAQEPIPPGSTVPFARQQPVAETPVVEVPKEQFALDLPGIPMERLIPRDRVLRAMAITEDKKNIPNLRFATGLRPMELQKTIGDLKKEGAIAFNKKANEWELTPAGTERVQTPVELPAAPPTTPPAAPAKTATLSPVPPAETAEPPVPKGYTRLWRSESGEPEAKIPDWMYEIPGFEENVAARGRWFSDADEARRDWYKKEAGANFVEKYIDIPNEQVAAYSVKNNPEALKFSREPDFEYYLSKDIADKAIQVDKSTKQPAETVTPITPPEASRGTEPVTSEIVGGAGARGTELPVSRVPARGQGPAGAGVEGLGVPNVPAARVDGREEVAEPTLTAAPAAPPPRGPTPPGPPSGAAPTPPTPPTPPRPTTPRQVKQAVQTALNSVTQSIIDRPNYTDSYGQKIIGWIGNLPLSKRKIQFALYTLSQMKQLLSTIMPGVAFLEKVNGRRAAQTSQELQHVAENQSKYKNIIARHPKAKWEKLKEVAKLGTLYQVDPTDPSVKQLHNDVSSRIKNVESLTPVEKMQYKIAEMYYSLPTDLRGILISDDGKSGIVPEYRKYRRQKFEAMVRNWIKQKMPLSDIARLRQEFNDPKNNLSFYIPLRRDQGVYLLEYADINNNVVSKRFGNPIERAAFKQRIEAQGVNKETIKEFSRYSDIKGEDSGKPPVGFLGEIVAMLETAIPSTMTTAEGKVLVNQAKKDLIGEVYDIFLDYMPQNTLRQELSSRKVFDLGGGLKQFGVFGFNEDFLETYVKETPRIIYQLNNLRWVLPIENAVRKLDEQRKQYNDGRDNVAFMRGRLDMPPEQVNEAFDSIRKRVDFGYSPTYAPWVHAFTTSNYVLSIAANVSSGLINTTVIPLLAIPILAAKYGVRPTLGAIARASAMFAKAPKEGGFKALGVRIGDWSIANGATGEYEQFFKKLVSRGVIGAASEQELLQAQRLDITGYESLGDKVNYLAGYVMKNSERFNREVTLLASFMLAREKGKNFTDAFEEAINDNSDVNGASIPASDSRLYQSGLGRVLLTFRKHILNAMILVAGTFKEALAKIEPLDQAASPAQKAQSIAKQKLLRTMARKRLLGIYAGAYMVSGIGGMPLFGAAEVFAAMLMGEDDEPYDLQEEVMEVLGELGLNGPVNALFNLDVASRTGFTDVLWRDDPQRLAEVGYITFGLEKLAGPTFSNAANWQRGLGLIADGYTQRGAEALMPAAARNASKALRYALEGARTKNGVLIKDDINAWNMSMQVLGFAPADLATTQARTNAEFEITKKLRQRRTALLTQLYVGVSAGNGDAVRDARKSIANFNRANPSIMIKFDTIERSFKERDRRNAESVDGLYIEKNLRQATIPYVSPRN